MKIFIKAISVFLLVLFSLTKSVQARISNPAIGIWGNDAGAGTGTLFVKYFVTIWNNLIVIGSLLVLINFLWGAFEWITAGGDSGKLGNARNRMLQSVIGLIILVSSYTIIGFISTLFFGTEFNILSPIIRVPA